MVAPASLPDPLQQRAAVAQHLLCVDHRGDEQPPKMAWSERLQFAHLQSSMMRMHPSAHQQQHDNMISPATLTQEQRGGQRMRII